MDFTRDFLAEVVRENAAWRQDFHIQQDYNAEGMLAGAPTKRPGQVAWLLGGAGALPSSRSPSGSPSPADFERKGRSRRSSDEANLRPRRIDNRVRTIGIWPSMRFGGPRSLTYTLEPLNDTTLDKCRPSIAAAT